MENEGQDYQEFAAGSDLGNPTLEDENVLALEETETSGEENTSTPVFRKWIRRLIYAAALLTPILFLPFTADALEFNKQVVLIAVACAGLILYLLDLIKSGYLKWKPSFFYLPIVGFVLAGAVSVIFSVNRLYSLFGSDVSRSFSFVGLASLAIIFFLALNVIDDRGRVLKKVLMTSLALALLFGALQILGLFIFPGFKTNSFNSVGSPNVLALLAAVSLVFFASFWTGSKEDTGEQGKWGWIMDFVKYAGFLLALFLIVLANWWVVWTVAFVVLLASVAFGSARDAALPKKGKMRLFAIPMAVIVVGIFLMLINFSWSLKSRLSVEVSPTQGTSLNIALKSLKSRPLGFGLGNFDIAYDKFKPADIANSIFYQLRFKDAGSQAMNIAVEGGILMILAALALLWFYGRALVSGIKNAFGGHADTSAAWAVSLGLLTAFFLYPFNLTLLILLVFSLILVGLTTGTAETKSINLERDAKYSFLGSLIFIIGLVLVLVIGYFTVNNYLANFYLAKAAKAKEIDSAINLFVKSANNDQNNAQVYRSLSQTLLAQLANDLKTGPKKDQSGENYNAKIQNEIASAVDVASRATAVDPSDSQNWFNRGLVYQNLIGLVGGADQAAVNMFKESLARNPADPTAYLQIGNVYLSAADNIDKIIANPPQGSNLNFTDLRKQVSDNLAQAGDNFEKSIALYNNLGPALYNLAVVYDRQGKLPAAIKQFEKLQAGNPRDPSIVFQLGMLYYRNDQKDNAFKAWQRAVFLFPNYSNARWYLSLLYEERGDLANALAQVQEIQRLNPDNEMVQQRLAQLQAGKRTIPPEKVLDKKPLQ